MTALVVLDTVERLRDSQFGRLDSQVAILKPWT